MFTNIGGKIKIVAQVITWIGIVCSVISGVVLVINAGFIPGLLTAVFGSLFSWLGALAMYGFGELVENSDIRTNLAIKADAERSEKQQ